MDSRRIPRVPRYSGYCYVNRRFAYGAVTRYGRSFQNVLLALTVQSRSPTTPAAHCYVAGLGCSPVARHYWGNHCCFLFLEVLRCFSSLRSPPDIHPDDSPSDCRVVPFGNPRIKGHLHLPAAYRSLSRPSSPPRAKASAVRPSILSRSTTTLACCCSSYFQLYS